MSLKDFNANNLFEEIKKIIDLPDSVISFSLHLKINEKPIVEIVTYAEKELKYSPNQTIYKKYKLVEINE